MLQDTTEFTYQRRDPHEIGFTKSVNSGRDKSGRLRHHAVCGILMHSSLVVTEEGMPLGLAAVKFWNRDKFKGTAQYKRIRVCPAIGKQKRYPSLDLTVIHASEVGAPSGRKLILWKLVTDLNVRCLAKVIEKIRWYAMRRKIEIFHKILKSGCRTENAKLRTANWLANLVALFCIVSWRVMWMTMIARTHPKAEPELAFTPAEIAILDRLIAKGGNRGAKAGTLQFYLTKLARLGGYLARKADPPPGNTVVWRGLRCLVNMQIGAELATYG